MTSRPVLHRGANFLRAAPLSEPEEVQYTHLLLQNEIPFDTTLAYLSHCYRTHRISFFNPSPLPTHDQIRTFPWEQLDWLIVNEGEALDLLAIMSGDREIAPFNAMGQPLRETDSADCVALTERLLHDLHGNPLFSKKVDIICTLGPLGVLALVHSSIDRGVVETLYVPAANISPQSVRDTTGAGDCFTGYLVAGLMELQPTAKPDKGTEKGLLPGDRMRAVLERCVEVSVTMTITGQSADFPVGIRTLCTKTWRDGEYAIQGSG